MRHFALTIIFAILGVYTASATDDITRILIYQTVPTTRSIVEDIPEAFISKDILSVSFDGSGMYSLYIEDRFGVTVFTPLPCRQTAWSTTTTSPASEKDSSASSSPAPPANTRATSQSNNHHQSTFIQKMHHNKIIFFLLGKNAFK